MQDLKEIPMDQKHREEFIDIFDRTREANGYEKIEKADISELSSAHEAKASRCACFGELGFNDEASRFRIFTDAGSIKQVNGFEPNLSLSTDKCNVISCYVNFEPKSVSYGWVSVLFEREGALYTFLICIHDANLGNLYPNLITEVSKIIAVKGDLGVEYKYSPDLDWNLQSFHTFLPSFMNFMLPRDELEVIMLVKSIRKYCNSHNFIKRFRRTDNQHITWVHVTCCGPEA